MSYFTYDSYNDYNTNRSTGNGQRSSTKVGYFRMKDCEKALVRIKCSSIADLTFATIHETPFGKGIESLGPAGKMQAKVMCLNELGSYSSKCPICAAIAQGDETFKKASKKVFIEMLIRYQDKKTGEFLPAEPVIWEKPAAFSGELATKLANYGSLTDQLFIITKTGTGLDTRYTLDIAMPNIYKPEMIPNDFSAFNNFSVGKHSFFEKTAEDIIAFYDTGAFPEVIKENQEEASTAPKMTPEAEAQAKAVLFGETPAPQPQVQPQAPVNFTQAAEQPFPQAAVQQPVQEAPQAAPVRKFNFNM